MKNSRNSMVMVVAFVLLFASLSACGQKGPLRRPEQNITEYIPSEKKLAAVAAFHIS